MSLTVYRSRKGITAYCAKCRERFHTDDPRYEASEAAIDRFQKDHVHVGKRRH